MEGTKKQEGRHMDREGWVRSILYMLERMSTEQIREAVEALWRIWTHGKGGR